MDWKKKALWLDFEMPLVELEERIQTLEDSASVRDMDVTDEVQRLRTKASKLGHLMKPAVAYRAPHRKPAGGASGPERETA